MHFYTPVRPLFSPALILLEGPLPPQRPRSSSGRSSHHLRRGVHQRASSSVDNGKCDVTVSAKSYRRACDAPPPTHHDISVHGKPGNYTVDYPHLREP